MKLVVFGLTVSSSWGNGHATLWRGLSRALAKNQRARWPPQRLGWAGLSPGGHRGLPGLAAAPPKATARAPTRPKAEGPAGRTPCLAHGLRPVAVAAQPRSKPARGGGAQAGAAITSR